MNKRYKLLSLLLSAGIVTSAFPSSGTGATSDSIAFYNSKKSILEMKEYDEAYDTNHDGIVNVFDVIRENKEVFQEESYTDLKAQIHSLETQIEILTQKLAEKEDKSQVESDVSGINTALSGKVNIQDGKQLSSNDYTDEEKQKLENLNNYDDTSIKSEISSELSKKVDVQEGKQLSSNDYTDEDKIKLSSLENYNDNGIKSEISNINTELSSINNSLSSKVNQQEGKMLSSNDYTDRDKKKLESLNNYDDTEVKIELQNQNQLIDSLIDIAIEEKNIYDSIIYSIEDNKVDKEEGKQLSSNDYTDEEKQKLESLNNYDDTEIKNKINEISINLTKQTNIYIRSDGKGDYKTIQDAIDNCEDSENNHVIIYLSDGVFDSFSMIKNDRRIRYIDIIGEGSDRTQVISYTGNYSTPAAEIWTNGLIKGVKFKMHATIETYNGESDMPYAYAVHDDFGTEKIIYEDCFFTSNSGPALGMGMSENKNVVFKNCYFEQIGDGTYGSTSLGALFCHDSTCQGSIGQYLEINNCIAVNYNAINQRGGIFVADQDADGEFVILIKNSASYFEDTPSSTIPNSFLSKLSYNNVLGD